MKKHILFLSLFVLLILSFGFLFNTKVSSADTTLPPGCAPGDNFSYLTGEACVTNSTLPPGCTSTEGYSPITGVRCDTTISSNLPAGCTSTAGFSPLTGVSCSSGTSFPPGCTSSNGFSATTGEPCSGTATQGPVISGVSGPQTLNVGQTGTWKVSASDSNGENLSYLVYWGDEPSLSGAMGASGGFSTPQQTATFTHSYTQAGVYSPTFLVRSVSGAAHTTLSVSVGKVVPTSSISVLSPNGGQFSQGQKITISFSASGFNSTDVVYARLIKVSDPDTIVDTPFFSNLNFSQSWPYTIPTTISSGNYFIRFDLRIGIGVGATFKNIGASVPFTITSGTIVPICKFPNVLNVTTNTCSPAPVKGSCSATHYSCNAGTSTDNGMGISAYHWTCAGSNGGANASCTESTTGATTPLTITTSSPLPNAKVGIYYAQYIGVAGNNNDYVWSVSSGSLPSGIELHPSSCTTSTCAATGVLSGGPNIPGIYTFSLQVVSNSKTATKQFSITVDPATNGVNGSCGATHYNCNAGTSINNGLGISAYSWTCAGSNGGANASCTESTTGATTPLTITTSSPLPNAKVGIYYAQYIGVAGNNNDYVWSVSSGSLPSGIELHPSSCTTSTCAATGVLSGGPNIPGIYTFSLQVVSNSKTATKQFSITVDPATNGVNGSCGATHYNCNAGTSINNGLGISAYSWTCAGSNGGANDYCSESTARTSSPGTAVYSTLSSLNGGSYSFSVTGGPASTPGTLVVVSENNRTQSNWFTTDANGNASKGPWVCSAAKTDVIYIQWPDGTKTNQVSHTCLGQGLVQGAESFHFTQFLARGSSGNEVMELQKVLTTLGYYSGVVDGKFGTATESAVFKFQTAHKLAKMDGKVGPTTRALLNQ